MTAEHQFWRGDGFPKTRSFAVSCCPLRWIPSPMFPPGGCQSASRATESPFTRVEQVNGLGGSWTKLWGALFAGSKFLFWDAEECNSRILIDFRIKWTPIFQIPVMCGLKKGV